MTKEKENYFETEIIKCKTNSINMDLVLFSLLEAQVDDSDPSSASEADSLGRNESDDGVPDGQDSQASGSSSAEAALKTFISPGKSKDEDEKIKEEKGNTASPDQPLDEAPTVPILKVPSIRTSHAAATDLISRRYAEAAEAAVRNMKIKNKLKRIVDSMYFQD